MRIFFTHKRLVSISYTIRHNNLLASWAGALLPRSTFSRWHRNIQSHFDVGATHTRNWGENF